MQELWQPIDGADGYEVSNLGQMRVTRYLQTSRRGGTGYRTVTLPGGKQRYVHRLVAEAFVDNPDKLPEVNHIDSNPDNAAASNLEWVDSQQNKIHAIKHGNRKRKLGSIQIKQIKKRLSTGESLKSIAKDFDVSFSTVSRIGRGEIYRWA